jgi:hypothetical protein
MSEAVPDKEVTKVRTVPWWVGPAFALLALGTVPWVIFLAITLPRHATFHHYRGVWVGFDVGLIAVLALTGFLAWRGRPQVALAATAAGTMLVVDAWFDVLTTPRSHGLLVSIVLAVLVELPLATICLWVAWHANHVVANRIVIMARRVSRAERRAASAAALVPEQPSTDPRQAPADPLRDPRNP